MPFFGMLKVGALQSVLAMFCWFFFIADVIGIFIDIFKGCHQWMPRKSPQEQSRSVSGSHIEYAAV
jgi:hypothetical protein